MKVVYTAAHLLHDPQTGIEQSRLMSPWEHIGRGEAIHATLSTDDRFSLVAPTDWGTDPITAVHDAGLLRFLGTAWNEYQLAAGPTADVVPDVFYRPALRHGMTPGREPTSPHRNSRPSSRRCAPRPCSTTPG